MRRRTVLAQVTVFGVISLLILGYTLFGLLKVDVTGGPFSVTVQLSRAGGIYEHAAVSYRGVQVGTVSAVDLRTDGVTVTLAVDDGTRVPDNARANVHNLSAVGEQYVDLVPPTSPEPSSTFLHEGSVIPVNRTSTPLATATVLFDLERFINSINPADLRVLGREGALAFTNAGAKLKSILTDTTDIVEQLSTSQDAMLRLLRNSALLLRGAAAHAGDFDRFSTSLRSLTRTLARSTPTIDLLLRQAVPTTRLVDTLVRENGNAATVLLGNLATLTDIQTARIPALRTTLVAVPEFARLAPQLVQNGTLLGTGNINQDQKLCNTGLPLTSPISGTKTKLYRVQCGTDLVRGAANAPRPGGTGTNAASVTPLGASAQRTSGGQQVGTYDPSSGLMSTADGKLVRLGSNGGQSTLLGGNSWQAVLLAGTGG